MIYKIKPQNKYIFDDKLYIFIALMDGLQLFLIELCMK